MFDSRLPSRPADFQRLDLICWTLQQTAFRLSDGPQTVLRHSNTSSEEARYQLLLDHDALNIDELSGTVTIDNARVRDNALSRVSQMTQMYRPAAITGAHLEKELSAWRQEAERHFGTAVKGFPVAIPIRIRAQYQSGQATELQYFLLAELPTEKITAEVHRLDIAGGRVRPTARPPTTPSKSRADAEIVQLRQKIELLESRVDLLTKQLAELIKRIPPPTEDDR